MKTLYAIVVLLIAAGCKEPPREAPELHGTWEPTWVLLTDVVERSGMEYDVYIVDTTNWEKKRNMKPQQVTYFADGTFKGVHRDRRDSIFAISTGTWEVYGDSLYFRQFTPDTFFATYWYKVSEDTLHLQGIIDWERNGKRDDRITSTERKIQ